MQNNTQGFTLIELLIVIAIIAILAAVLIPNLLGAQKRAYDAGAISCGKGIQNALSIYYVDHGAYTTPAKKIAGVDEDIEACTPTEVTISDASAEGGDYTFTVQDSRGANKYTFTSTGMSTSKQAAATTTTSN